jgi:hypothetical protein
LGCRLGKIGWVGCTENRVGVVEEVTNMGMAEECVAAGKRAGLVRKCRLLEYCSGGVDCVGLLFDESGAVWTRMNYGQRKEAALGNYSPAGSLSENQDEGDGGVRDYRNGEALLMRMVSRSLAWKPLVSGSTAGDSGAASIAPLPAGRESEPATDLARSVSPRRPQSC